MTNIAYSTKRLLSFLFLLSQLISQSIITNQLIQHLYRFSSATQHLPYNKRTQIRSLTSC